MCLQYIGVVVITLVGNFIIGLVLTEHKNRVSFMHTYSHALIIEDLFTHL